jgi:hypothetical protein
MIEQITPLNIVEEGQTLWGTDRQAAGCPHCQRAFLVKKEQINTLCPLCSMGHLEPQPLRLRPTEPERLLPFRIKSQNLQSIYDGFISGVWIKPEDFSVENLLRRTRAIFWPLWLVDSDVKGRWQMEAGFYYQVESSKEYYQDGGWHSRTIVENRINWEPRLGELETDINNVAVQALEEHQNRQLMTGGYSLDKAINFQADLLNSAVIEAPDLPPEDAWPQAKPKIDRSLALVCEKAAGAQHSRNFAFKGEYHNLNWTQFLLPMYVTFYKDDDGEPQILVINGETGEIKGPRLASQKRGLRIAAILGGIAGLLLILALLGFFLTAVFPPAGIIAALLAVFGFGAGLSALFPAIWPAQWNRTHQEPTLTKRS